MAALTQIAWSASSALGFVSLAVTLLGVACAGYGIVRFLSANRRPAQPASAMWKDRITRFGLTGFAVGVALQVIVFVLRLNLPG
jgi:hypothetical protein